MDQKLASLFSEVPPKPDYNPVRKAIESSKDPDAATVLKLFASMPAATSVFANPVRHRHQIPARGATLDLDIRSFALRGKLFEEDIVAGRADAIRVIFVGLFSRLPQQNEADSLKQFIADSLTAGLKRAAGPVQEFMKTFPEAPPDVAMQYFASFRKASRRIGPINSSRVPSELLAEMIEVHMENVGVAALASLLRKRTFQQLDSQLPVKHASEFLFRALLGHSPNPDEMKILGQLGAIQVHHGSAGSSMVARYFATLHTRSVSDLFTASQMALDCGRHFGAISDMTDFVHVLEQTSEGERDNVIRARILKGSLPTFGHPEIAAAGRENHLEMDPRPALYLAPLFDAIDRGVIAVTPQVQRRVALVERIYQIALFEGVEKSTRRGWLRLTPNTDFGAWLVQEVLGIEEPDRTLLSYAHRGFGWMMDVREQLQQPIIRPVIPTDPAVVPGPSESNVIPSIISSVHQRLAAGNAFAKKTF